MVKGNPSSPHNKGKICAKGTAAIANLYDPERLKKPLKRTNEAKGFGVEPGWKEIEWDEALSEIGERLKKVREDDPRKLVFMTFDTHAAHLYRSWVSAFGSSNYEVGTPNFFCGNNVHPFTYLAHGAFFMEPDLDHCKYLILFGCQFGHTILSNAMESAKKLAEARERGLKLVVVDPVCSKVAGKADEWIPIRPGTDAAFALGILNLLLNELKAYDKEFLKKYTNGSYLLKSDGTYLRDADTKKPMVWDISQEKGLPFDQVSGSDAAIEGEFTVNDNTCTPAFQKLKDHVASYSPEKVSSITTTPVETIKRIASEFAQAASIGSTISLEGKSFPLRTVAALWNRGPSQHKHAMLTGFSMYLLNLMVGAVDVPGGMLGSNAVGPGWGPQQDVDGIIIPSGELSAKPIVVPTIYPPAKVKSPERISLRELFPVAPYSGIFMIEALLEPEKYGLPYSPEVLVVTRTNPLISGADPSKMARAFMKIPFIVSISSKVDETAELADYVLPDPALLELLLPFANRLEKPMGGQSWYSLIAQPVVTPDVKYSHPFELLYRLAEKAGFLDELHSKLNTDLNLKDKHKLEGSNPTDWQDICDRWLRSMISEEKGLEWFKREGVFVLREKMIDEIYPRPHTTGRSLIYLEHMKQAGEDVSELTEKMGLKWDLSDYQPLPDWKPCPSYSDKPERSLYIVNFKLPEQALSTGYTVSNPWLQNLTEANRGFHVLINPQKAEELKIRDGDSISLESEFGYRARAIAKITEGIHPEVVGVPGAFGHWAKGLGKETDRGIHWNSFIPIRPDRIDMVSAAVDTCVRVSINKE